MQDVESCCSSDDEVFFGPITEKEIKKASELRRRTLILRPVSECADETPDNISAGTEESRQSLTLTSRCAGRKEDVTMLWRCRSMDMPLDCDDSGEAETVAPPPSPELRYNGSPYPTPNHSRRRLCSTLGRIAEEEWRRGGAEMQSTPVHSSLLSRYSDAEQSGEWTDGRSLPCSSVASDASSGLADGLAEDTSRLSLVPVMPCKETLQTSAFLGETPQVSEEELKIRDILIEKMEEHEARTQRLRGTKKQTASMPRDFKKTLLFEPENYDMILLDDAKNDVSLNDNTPGSQEAEIWNDDNLEVTTTGSEPTTENYQQLTPNTAATGGEAEGCRFSRSIPERDFASREGRLVGDLGDPECREDREEVDDTVTALESQTSEVGGTDNHGLNDPSFTAPARPSSPEFDIEMPEATAPLPGNVTAEYSLISEADECLREKGEVEACNTNCAVVGRAEVSADEDGGFLSVLSEAAVYHASLKHATAEPFDRGDGVQLTGNIATCSECCEDASHCGCGSAVALSACQERDSMEMQLEPLPLCAASGEFREERRGQEECPGGDLGKTGAGDDDDSSPYTYIVQESSVLDSTSGSLTGSWGREMDALGDLNDSDRRKIGHTKRLESCSGEEEFHDSLEEIELLLQFGMDYMMSADDEQCHGTKGEKQCLSDSTSAPVKPLREMSEFEDFGDAVDHIESHRHLADGTETSCEDRSAVAIESYSHLADGTETSCEDRSAVAIESYSHLADGTETSCDHHSAVAIESYCHLADGTETSCEDRSAVAIESYCHLADGTETSCDHHSAVAIETCVSSVSDHNSVPSSHHGKTAPLSEAGEGRFVKPQTTSVRKPHTKLRAVVSPIVTGNKPSPFKPPGKLVLAGTPLLKLLPPRSARKSPLKPIVTASPCRRPANYSQIVSPVGAYIHGTARPTLVTIVKPKPLHAATPKGTTVGRGATAVEGQENTPQEVPCKLERKGRENVDTSNIHPVLPIVSYESVPSVKLKQPQWGRLPRLNDKMKKLVDTPKPHVFRHEGRVKVTASPRTPNVKVTSMKKPLADLDSSYVAPICADGEISVVISKQATRTNTLGV